MSADRYWCPMVPDERNFIDLNLARPIARKYLQQDGSMSDELIMGNGSIDFLEGLKYSGVDGAQELIDAIEKYGEIKFVITHG